MVPGRYIQFLNSSTSVKLFSQIFTYNFFFFLTGNGSRGSIKAHASKVGEAAK